MLSARACARALALLAGLMGVLGLSSAEASAANFTWTGLAGTELWSSQANWLGGSAPGGSVGTVSFPALACNPMTLCISRIDSEGVSANALSFDDASGYVVGPLTMSDSAEALSIGAGGLSAGTQATSAPFGTPLLGPLTFAGTETWTVDGGPAGIGALTVGQITGSTSGVGTLHPLAPALALNLAHGGTLTLAGNGVDNELGTLAVNGASTADTGASAGANGTIDFSSPGGALNAANRTSITLHDAALIGAASVGPLTATGSLIGFPAGSVGTLQVGGSVSLGAGTLLDLPLVGSGSSIPAGNDYAQLSATGHMNLNGASLKLVPGSVRCPSLRAGDVDSILTAVGGVSGTFTGLPNGSTLTLACTGQQPTIRINYTPTSVTATAQSAGGPAYPVAVTLSGPLSPPAAGQSMQLSATSTPTPTSGQASHGSVPAGTLTFFEDGQAISGCTSEPLGPSGSGVAGTCRLNAPSGPHSYTAAYTPNTTDWAASASNPVTITATPPPPPVVPTSTSPVAPTLVPAPPTPLGPPVMTLSAGRDPNNPELLIDTATLAPPKQMGGTVSGQVSFSDGPVAIPGCSAVPLVGGRASCQTGFQTPGAQTITAVYTSAGSTGATASAQATVHSALTTPTASFSHVRGRRLAFSITVQSPEALFSGYRVQFLTPGIRFARHTALMASDGRLSVTQGTLLLRLPYRALSAYFLVGAGALKLTRSLPPHGTIQAMVTLTFPHAPSAQLLLSIPAVASATT